MEGAWCSASWNKAKGDLLDNALETQGIYGRRLTSSFFKPMCHYPKERNTCVVSRRVGSISAEEASGANWELTLELSCRYSRKWKRMKDGTELDFYGDSARRRELKGGHGNSTK